MLIKVYPTDDSSKIKRLTETVNQRYTNLIGVVINRGKLLHTAVHNLQSFDRSMDQASEPVRAIVGGGPGAKSVGLIVGVCVRFLYLVSCLAE